MKKLLNLSLRRKGMFRAFVSRMVLCLTLMMSTLSAVAEVTPVKPEGSGRIDDPVLIASLENLLYYMQAEKYHFAYWVCLTADIDLSPVCHPADPSRNIEEASWKPGNLYGNFWGNGHTIKNLYIHERETDGKPKGLFSEANIKDYHDDIAFTITDLNLESVNIIVENTKASEDTPCRLPQYGARASSPTRMWTHCAPTEYTLT